MNRITRFAARTLATLVVPALLLTGSGPAFAAPAPSQDNGITFTDGSEYDTVPMDIGSCSTMSEQDFTAQQSFVAAHVKETFPTPLPGVVAFQFGTQATIFVNEPLCELAIVAFPGAVASFTDATAPANVQATYNTDTFAGCYTTRVPLKTAADAVDADCTISFIMSDGSEVPVGMK